MWGNPRIIKEKKLNVAGGWQALQTYGILRMVVPSILMGNSWWERSSAGESLINFPQYLFFRALILIRTISLPSFSG